MDFSKSAAAYKEARLSMPGGVNSPVRSFPAVDLNPIYMDHGKGSKVYDLDGNEYIDYVLEWGPLILGHADERVLEFVKQTADKGFGFGAPHVLETQLAELVKNRVPSIEMIRMVNSGTEATMSAIRLARGYTGRDVILKFEGCYHGSSDSLLIKAGSGVATLGLPDSPGVPAQLAKDTLTVPYNDPESVAEVFKRFGQDIACVIVEPVGGNMGVVPPMPGFLESLRKITKEYGSLLIFDEVMTGFRVDYHCAQGYLGVIPDLTTLGKVIGGGLPVGAYGGKSEIMKMVAPEGPVYQAGTLSGNPLAMAAGYMTLSQLKPEDYTVFHEQAKILTEGFKAAASKYGIALSINQVGAMMSFFFTDQKVTDYKSAKSSDLDRFKTYFAAMIEQGISLPPSQFESVFLSTRHSMNDVEKTIDAAEHAFRKIAES
ncbi:glutamate-1-semialdehyde-2,1-aminomutase [Sporolactobacillus shoreae]|uniref:Glutamate-1-semialdehyde 2,1-aminomutase n=2 Tax=Sporolactobacillus shoreae TaxID=1465501 RepID=A0A4Z0GLN4_9BACL|nr:glutamate-1-semialdehyde-2,1-aminomutase [Sporolactobacillus shoreae]